MTKRSSPLKTEIDNLYRRLEETSVHMSDLEELFWRRGGVCCPSCGVEGYSSLLAKQERREKRIQGLLIKLQTHKDNQCENSGGSLDLERHYQALIDTLEYRLKYTNYRTCGEIRNKITRLEKKRKKILTRLDPDYNNRNSVNTIEASEPDLPLLWETT